MNPRISILLLSLLACSCASTKLDTKATKFSKESLVEGSEIQQQQDADAAIIRAIESSDDFAEHREIFTTASTQLIDEGKCSLKALDYNGGWVRSQRHRGKAVYFTYTVAQGATVRDRIYLDVSTGEVFK